MKYFKFIYLLSLGLLLFSCQKDPMDEVEDGKWNKERNILEMTVEGQVGNTIITRNGNEATVEFIYNTVNFTEDKVKLKTIAASFGAECSAKVGDVINFTKDVTFKVTPVHGEPLEWKIILTPFVETLEGTWSIKDFVVYGGTGAEYGGTGVLSMCDRPWAFSDSEGPKVELDNEIIFTLDEISPDGNSTNGRIVNNAGSDGKYADFVFIASTPKADVNHFYRQLPKGEGRWVRNYKNNTVAITFADNTTHTCTLRNAGDEVYLDSNKGTRAISGTSLEFKLKGVDDWNTIYQDFDKFVSNPRLFWIDLKK